MIQAESYVSKQNISKGFLRNPGKPPLLSRLDMELTERCNNNCVHCCINRPMDDLEAKNKELTTEEIKKILKESVSLGCLTVRFTGGEPLLREDFEELYIFSRRLGLRVMIFTNATLVTPHLADLFARIHPLEKIEVSVYGMKKSSYEAVSRSPGSYEAAWKGINLLLEYKIPFVVKSPILPYNKSEIDEFKSWALTIPWMDKPPGHSMFFDLRCGDDKDRNRLIKSLRVSPEEGLSVLTRRKDEYIKEMKQFCGKFIGPSGDRLFACGSGKGGGRVDAYGAFHPCLMMRNPDMAYDIKTGSLESAILNFFQKVREIKAVNPDYLSRCAKCFLKGLCEQCPAKSWLEHNTLDTPIEYLCKIAHAQARFLGLIKDNENAWEVKEWKQRIEKFCEK